MKWINLAERQPKWDTVQDIERLVLRNTEDKDIQPTEIIVAEFKESKDHAFFEQWEWLDESEDDIPIEESRCCEQNDKLRAALYKLSRVKGDTPLGDIFAEIEKFMPVSAEYGYEPNDYPSDFWAEVSPDTKATFYGMLHIVPPEYGDILQHYIQVIDSMLEDKKEQKQHIIDIMKADEKNGLYDI